MTSEQKRIAKEQAIAGHLLNHALDRLGELTAPYVLLIGGKLLSNQSELVARAIVCETANLLVAIEEKRVEAAADRIVFGFNDPGDDQSKHHE